MTLPYGGVLPCWMHGCALNDRWFQMPAACTRSCQQLLAIWSFQQLLLTKEGAGGRCPSCARMQSLAIAASDAHLVDLELTATCIASCC